MTSQPRSIAMQVLGLAVAAALTGSVPVARAQMESGYASIATKDIDYRGPGREPAYDLKDETIPIGLVAPLHGPRQAEGEAIVAAAQMAIADAAARDPLPGGRRLALALGDESGPAWSATAAALSQLILDQHAIAVITSANGATAHLSEQVGNRIGIAVLTLASDKTTTQIDLPWIFRLGPTDAQEARIIAQEIYRSRAFRRVLLVTENDHDGRRGAAEFRAAVREIGAAPPTSLVLNVERPDAQTIVDGIRANASETVVLWTRACTSRLLIQAIRKEAIAIPIYLTQEAAQEIPTPQTELAENQARISIWSLASESQPSPTRQNFVRRFRDDRGVDPSPVAAEAYDAVLLIAQVLGVAGPNRARVRDRIAAIRNWPGVSGEITFDGAGNNLARVLLVRLR